MYVFSSCYVTGFITCCLKIMMKAVFLAFLIANIFKGISANTAVNIAWNSTLSICNKPQHSSNVFDGDRFMLALTHTEECETDFTVNLGDGFDVQYVILYGGETSVSGVARFDVEFRVFAKYAECGKFIRRRTIDFRGMRVNCMETFKTDVVSIDVNNVPFYLNEIEIYAFDDDGHMMIYRGCFKTFGFKAKFDRLTSYMCKWYCILNWRTFVAFKGPDCFCSDEIDFTQETTEDQCSTVCHDTLVKACGGKETYSVFIVKVRLPTYKLCSEDFNISDTTETDDMTTAKCLQLCDDYFYAALKEGSKCGCFDNLPVLDILSDDNCSVPCIGDPNFYCGGGHSWSIYRTCKDCIYGTQPCSKILHCLRSYDVYGVCQGGCQEGYIGEHCIEKKADSQLELHKCTVDACEAKPNSYCYYNRKARMSLCYCNEGFWSPMSVQVCEDIDECKYHACNHETSTCQNTLGSYRCKCKSGYHQETPHICSAKRLLKALSILTAALVVVLCLLSVTIVIFLAWRMKRP